MGVIIESEIWEPNKSIFILLFGSSLLSIFSFPLFITNNNINNNNNNTNNTLFHDKFSNSFIRFQRNFLLIFSVSSVLEGLCSVIGEYESYYYDTGKEQIALSLCLGCAAALLLGTFSGVISDLIGHKKVCLIFCALHLCVGVSKIIFSHPSLWFASICLSLASSIFSFSFETWMMVDHDKQGHRHDTLNDLFWLMAFTESASFIGSQVIGNWLIGGTDKKSLFSPSAVVVFLAITSIIYASQGMKETLHTTSFQNYTKSFSSCILHDKRVWFLSWAQACLHFSISVFWIMWAPTIVADGREVNLGLIYPCLLGAKMLGSTTFPWFSTGPLAIRSEDCLMYVFIIMGFLLSIVTYDYQEVGVLVTLFCIFFACVGLVIPSLARLRTMYVPNDLRGGMMSLSLAPANAVTLLFLLQRSIFQNIENSTIFAFAALGLFSAAGCLYLLKRWGKQPHHDWRKL